MNRRKKVIIGFIAVLSLCCVLFAALCMYVMWYGIFSHIVPWTSTQFTDYQSYSSFLKNYRSLDQFLNELPTDAAEPKYYWHHESWEAFVAYATILPEETLRTLSDERMEFYRGQEEKFSTDKIIFSLHEDGYCYIDAPKWCDNEIITEEELAFINKVVSNTKVKDQYYYLVVIREDYTDTTCYNGVILNDDTHEFIEFSVDVVDPDKWHH